MAVPARNVSKTRGRTRRAHMALEAKQTTKCKKCGAFRKNKAAEDDNMDLIINLSVKK